MTRPDPKTVVVGLGYVGLPLAVRAVQTGDAVVGLDVDARRVDALAAGSSYVEDIPDATLRACLDSGRFLPTTDPEACVGFDVAVITVPTPLAGGSPDLSYVEAASRTLAGHLRPGALVVLESTSYPGTTQEVVGPLLEAGSGLTAGRDFALGYSPERIDPGNREWTLETTPKVISGVDAASLEEVRRFYDRIVVRTVAVPSPREAELAKLLENTFRHVNIALVNELAMFASDLGIDIWATIDAAATKPFGFLRFSPGPGVGGHCLPIDPSYLSWSVRKDLGRRFRFVELANDINEHMPDHVVRRVMLGLNRRGKAVNGARVLVLGLSYKRNTSDAREAPAAGVVSRLLALGAKVSACDPLVRDVDLPHGVDRVELDATVLADSDAVVLLTDHDAFDYELVTAHSSYVLDTRNRLKGDCVELL
ncbi:MAG: UDP-glucose/GDP-mannose dehydrogenase [Frankiales bacterium]|nr:UDP-glucose/GDP-mannose dehydrogenase [Frankiales bacterium]